MAAKKGRRSWQRRGLSVALLAPDGTGKTTLAAAIEAMSWSVPVRSIYMGFPIRDGVRGKMSRLPGLAIPLTWLRYARAAAHRRLGHLVIFDRYPYDYLVPANEAVAWFRRLHRWLLARACPAPDLVMVLDAPPETVAMRTRESNLRVLAERRRDYLALADRLNNAFVVDASRDRTAVRDHVAELIRQHAPTTGP